MMTSDVADLVIRIVKEGETKGQNASAFADGHRYLRAHVLGAAVTISTGVTDEGLFERLRLMCAVLEALKPPCIMPQPIDPDDLVEALSASLEQIERKKPTLRRV